MCLDSQDRDHSIDKRALIRTIDVLELASAGWMPRWRDRPSVKSQPTGSKAGRLTGTLFRATAQQPPSHPVARLGTGRRRIAVNRPGLDGGPHGSGRVFRPTLSRKAPPFKDGVVYSNHSSSASNFGKTMIKTFILPTARWRTPGGMTMQTPGLTGTSSSSSWIVACGSHSRM